MKKIKYIISIFLCLVMITPLTIVNAVENNYILNDGMVSNFNGQSDKNFNDSQTLIVGKGRHAYIRFDLSSIDKDNVEMISLEGSKKNGANTFIICQSNEFLVDGITKWDENNLTYNKRPSDISDSPVKQYEVANGNKNLSLDITELLLDAINDGKSVITLHITTDKVDDGITAASEIFSSRSTTPLSLKIDYANAEKPVSIESINNEGNYLDNGSIAQKTFLIKDEDGEYLKLKDDESFETTANENEAAIFNLYIFDYRDYQYAEDEINYAKKSYAIKCLDNNKYLTIQNYFNEQDTDKSYYNRINDGYEIKVGAVTVNWNERFELAYYQESDRYIITSHLTKLRDNADYATTMIRMDERLYSTTKNNEPYKFEFCDVINHDQLEVRQTVEGTNVKLSWYPVNDDQDISHYKVSKGNITLEGDKFIAQVNGLSAGEHQIVVEYNGKDSQSVTVQTQIFNHPGITHSPEELDAMKEHIINKEEPWYSDYQKLQTMVPDDMASSDYQPQALEAVGRGDNTPAGHNIVNYEQGGNAAYFNALQWVITGEDRYAQCVVNVLNAWSNTLKMVDGRDRILGAGINSYRYINAAEIIKYYHGGYKGYSDSDFKKFQTVMENVIYPAIEDLGAPMLANGNWDTAAMISMISIGVVCDNPEIYNRAVSLYQDIHVNGSIVNYVSDWGQSVESFRDQAHAQLGIGYMAEICQVALNQDKNLFDLYDNRLAKAFNWAAQYNLYDTNGLKMEPLTDVFGNTKWKIVDSEKINRGELRPVYELPLAYYSKVSSVDVTWMAKAAEAMRAQGYVHNDNLNFGTLTSYSGEATEVCEPFFQIRTRLEPWYQRTWNDAKKYGELIDNIPETLNSYFTVTNSGELTASSKKADAPYYQIENNQDGTYAIRCITTNTYLSVKDEQIGEENIIKADAKNISEKEKFVLKCTGAGFYYLVSPAYDNRIVYIDVENASDPQNAILTMRLGNKITKHSADISNNEKLILVYNTSQEALKNIDLADTTDLEVLVAKANEITNDENKYTQVSFQDLITALEKAEQGIIDAKYGRINDHQVTELYQLLNEALNNLVLLQNEDKKPDLEINNDAKVEEIVREFKGGVNTGDESAIYLMIGIVVISLGIVLKLKKKEY